jgi:hypothetical protein
VAAQAPLQAKIDEFAATHFAGAHVLGTHLRRRGWNKISVEQMDTAFRCVGDLRRRLLPADRRRVVLYVASDSARAYAAAVRAMQPMGGITVVHYNAVLTGDVRCVAVRVCVCGVGHLPSRCPWLLRAWGWRSTGVAGVYNGSSGRADRHLAAGPVRRAHPLAWIHLWSLRHTAHVGASARHPAGARPVQACGATPRLVVHGGRRWRRHSSRRLTGHDDSGGDGGSQGTQAAAAHDGAVHAAANVGVVLLRLEELLRLGPPQRR